MPTSDDHLTEAAAAIQQIMAARADEKHWVEIRDWHWWHERHDHGKSYAAIARETRALLEAQGVTVDELEDRLGLSVNNVQRVVTGREPQPPSPR